METKNLRRQAAVVTTHPEDLSAQPHTRGANLTRRAALRLLLGAGTVVGASGSLLPAPALAADHTAVDNAQAELDAAQAQYDEVEAQLAQLGEEYETLAKEQSETLDKIEQTQALIDEKQAQIDEKQEEIAATQREIERREKEIAEKQEVLGNRVSAAYKSGGKDFLAVLLSSQSFEELISNVYYLDRISEADAKFIGEIKAAKEELAEKKADLETQKADLEAAQDELEAQKAELEELNELQAQQLSEMKDKQAEVQSMLNSLSSEVAALVEKRDAEVMAYNKAQQQEAAAAAAAANNPAAAIALGGGEYSAATGSQQAIVNSCMTTPSPGAGYCAMWVSLVFQNAGYGYIGGDACDMYNAYCHSSNKDELKVGMAVAVSTHSHTSAGRIWGHIGIYIGNGLLMDNVGSIRTMNVDDWISYYGTTVTPRWGWAGNIVLS